MTSRDAILSEIEAQGIRFVELWFTDIMGVVKSVTIPVTRLETTMENGSHFDGSSVDGFARVAESDMVLRPDLETFVVLPWHSNPEARTARLICDVYTPQGEPFIGDPRGALVRMLQEAEAQNLRFKTGMEMEFFLFHLDAEGRPLLSTPYDEASYFDITTDQAQGIRREMMLALESMGIPVNSAHSEIGPGQHEIDFEYDDALRTADRMVTARVAMKAVAQHKGLHCTFMPRPRTDLPGSGMHTHQSLHDVATDENLLADANHEYGLSDLARHFLAGQLCHARGMAAVIAPLVNSYKRLGTSVEAPVYVSWAHINRSALIRIPSVTPGKEAHTRLELRAPDPSANPYLASAVMLGAGLDGINQQMALPDPLEETLLMQNRSRLRQVEALPHTLGEALDAMEQDDVILSALGPYISDRYLTAKRQEFEAYKQTVSQWEIERYINKY